jgi:hypothetical protein
MDGCFYGRGEHAPGCSSFGPEKAGGDFHRVFKMLLAKGRIDETAMERKIASIVTKPQHAYLDNHFT